MSIVRTLTAGESQVVSETGGRFYFESGDGEITVKVNLSGDSRVYDLVPGQGFVIPNGERFYSVEIHNGVVQQTIKFVISDAEIFDNRSTISSESDSLNVSIVEEKRDKNAQLGEAYRGAVYADQTVWVDRRNIVGVKNNGSSDIFVSVAELVSIGGPANPGFAYWFMAQDFEGMRSDFYDVEADADTVVDNAADFVSLSSTDPLLYSGASIFVAATVKEIVDINASVFSQSYCSNGNFLLSAKSRICLKPGGCIFAVTNAINTYLRANFEIEFV